MFPSFQKRLWIEYSICNQKAKVLVHRLCPMIWLYLSDFFCKIGLRDWIFKIYVIFIQWNDFNPLNIMLWVFSYRDRSWHSKRGKKSNLQNLYICHFYENDNIMGSLRKYVYQVIYSIWFWLVGLQVFLFLFSFILLCSTMKNLFLILTPFLRDYWNTQMR